MLSGLDRVEQDKTLTADWGRCGLVSNQSSITRDFTHAWQVLKQHIGDRLCVLFGPQHGFESTVQHNMIETDDAIHPASGLKIYSLYSRTREPTAAMMADIDTIVFDLPVTGCRIYTYKYTMSACLRAAKKFGKRVVILDRPNPLGGETVEGAVLDLAVRSFVGEFAIPTRHGLTMAEAGRVFNREIGAELEVVALQDWNPSQMLHETGVPYVLTSPNLPTIESVYCFPGGVAFEGVNASEGRGTCMPFQFYGAPYLKSSEHFVERVKELVPHTDGVHLRPAAFQPVAQKCADEVCYGVQLHVTEPKRLRSFKLGLAMLRACYEIGGASFSLIPPPYEYEDTIAPLALILGAQDLCDGVSASRFSLDDPMWTRGAQAYCQQVKPYMLYERTLTVSD